MTGPDGGVPWKGLGILACLAFVAYTVFAQSPSSGAVSSSPSVFVDQYGRLDFPRIAVIGGMMGAAATSVVWLLSSRFRERARAIRMSDMTAWVEDLCRGLKHDPVKTSEAIKFVIDRNPELSRATILSLFVPETEERREALKIARSASEKGDHILQRLADGDVENRKQMESLSHAMGELAREIRGLREERSRERIGDREEMGRLTEKVNQIHSRTYNGPDRRHDERRGTSEFRDG